MNYTPMIEQYLTIKKQHPQAILFFRLGDFYEMFFEDAELAARELEITLTGRDAGALGRVPMCGVPYHAAEGYIARLVQKGYHVALCEQVEDPQTARGLVKREVVRIITPGTVIEGQLLKDKQNNYLVSVFPVPQGFGLAVADISTGYFALADFTGEEAENRLLDELYKLMPAEIIFPLEAEVVGRVKNQSASFVTIYQPPLSDASACWELLREHFGSQQLAMQNIQLEQPAVLAAAALLSYLRTTQKCALAQLTAVERYVFQQVMHLDRSTIRNLEIFASLRDGSRRGTLLDVLDYTVTAMGGRLLKRWLEKPLCDVGKIRARQEAVAEFYGQLFLRQEVRACLEQVYDLERIIARAAHGTANARDLVLLRRSLAVLPTLKERLTACRAALLKETGDNLDLLTDIRTLLEKALVDDPPPGLKEGGLIKEGYHPEIDELRYLINSGKDLLLQVEQRERERTGIKSLKVGFNKVFGYYIEVTKPNLPAVPSDYRRKQTLANCERFTTPELEELAGRVLGGEERLYHLEYELFLQIRQQVVEAAARLQRTAQLVALIDVLQGLAEAAVRNAYNRPELEDSNRLIIRAGRHPVVEKMMPVGEFVPNDLEFNADRRIIILTGPNMAGKSTYMRQVALIVLMAQIGSFVPAEEAVIGLVDRIFTRIGAADDLAGGMSTFMVEMNECCTIVREATERSLIVMDEVGRGTSTYDGISLAQAIIEYLATRIRARTLFSTHYHELTSLDSLPGVSNFTMAVEERGKEITFLHRVVPGRADRSYGIHVARLAGLPEEILKRAQKILHELEIKSERKQRRRGNGGKVWEEEKENYNIFTWAVLNELECLNINEITPLAALNKIALWQSYLKAAGNRRG